MKHRWNFIEMKMLCTSIPWYHLQQNILPFCWASTNTLHTRGLSVAVETTPNCVPTQTHLLGDPQPQTDQIGIIHNVPVGEGGSFGASRCPLKDRGHYALPFPRMSHMLSGAISQADPGLIWHFILHSDLGDFIFFFNSILIPNHTVGPNSVSWTP